MLVCVENGFWGHDVYASTEEEKGRAEALAVIVHHAAGTGSVSEQRWSVNLPSGFSHKSH